MRQGPDYIQRGRGVRSLQSDSATFPRSMRVYDLKCLPVRSVRLGPKPTTISIRYRLKSFWRLLAYFAPSRLSRLVGKTRSSPRNRLISSTVSIRMPFLHDPLLVFRPSYACHFGGKTLDWGDDGDGKSEFIPIYLPMYVPT